MGWPWEAFLSFVTLVRRQGSQVSMRMARGSWSSLSSHGKRLGPQDTCSGWRHYFSLLNSGVTQEQGVGPGVTFRSAFLPQDGPLWWEVTLSQGQSLVALRSQSRGQSVQPSLPCLGPFSLRLQPLPRAAPCVCRGVGPGSHLGEAPGEKPRSDSRGSYP